MGHSFLYSQNYMFSRNALFWKVTGSKILLKHHTSDPSESESALSYSKLQTSYLKLSLINYQNQDQEGIYEIKKSTFYFLLN